MELDLGLPSGTKWNSCNVGANTPTEYGDYYAWGDVAVKDNYVGRTCETYDVDIVTLKFDDVLTIDNILSIEHDAAYHNCGKEWRIPSGEQAQELIDSCTWEWIENYEKTGINGRLGISKYNGVKIFFPAAGLISNTQKNLEGENGGYWTSSPNIVSSNRAWAIAFDSNTIDVFDHNFRYYGFSIRPVVL